MNAYHNKIKFTLERNPDKFLDTRLFLTDDGICKTEVYRKPNKIPVHWSSKIPKRYKRNAIWGDLTRSKRMSSDFQKETVCIRDKFRKAGFPTRFTNSVITQFQKKIINKEKMDDDDLLIPEYFFECPKPFILIEVPYCPENEKLSHHFLSKFKQFSDNRFTVSIKWKTKRVKNLFNLKSKNPHPACKIYLGVCSCEESYIGETKRNVETRWGEHNDPRGSSEPSKHLYQNPGHKFQWNIIMNASTNSRIRKNLEASWVALKKPSLNNQVDSKKLILFRHGVT